jgi:ATP-dependent protease ClpP protease subunit
MRDLKQTAPDHRLSTEDDMDVGSRPGYFGRTIGKCYSFYLSGVIGSADEYVSWFEEIRSAGSKDIIIFHINSPGGDLMTAIQFMRVMSESRATIVASIEGQCSSAATVIFLSAHQFEVSEHSMFMIHNYSTLTSGKGGEIYDRVQHERRWSSTFWNAVYGGFLSDAEIKTILDGKDLWMDGPEVIRRLKRKAKLAKKSRQVDATVPAEVITTDADTESEGVQVEPNTGKLIGDNNTE